MSAISTAALLIVSNLFMTAVWYGHLCFRDYSWGKNMGLFTIILISWGMALFEYIFQNKFMVLLYIFSKCQPTSVVSKAMSVPSVG
jgi:uncharacterized protein (DUF486 family)